MVQLSANFRVIQDHLIIITFLIELYCDKKQIFKTFYKVNPDSSAVYTFLFIFYLIFFNLMSLKE